MDLTIFNGDDDYNGTGVDKVITHELTHVFENNLLGYFPQFLMEGLAELTSGIDSDRRSTIVSLAKNADSLASFLDVNENGTGVEGYYAAGFMFYRYLAKQAADYYDSLASYGWKDNSSIVGTSAAEFLTGNGKNSTINADAGNDTITAYGDSMKIFGGDGDDSILTKAENVTINSGNGDDSIIIAYNNSYYNKITITGDAGDDYVSLGSSVRNALINYDSGDGNDIITGFNTSSTIQIGDGNASYMIDTIGNDILLTVADGTVLLKSSKTLSKLNIAGTLNDTAFDGELIYNSTADKNIVTGSGKDTIYNYSGGKNVTISSGAGSDSIYNAGDSVTIDTGEGHDSIYNENGSNITISGGAGNDSVYNYSGSSISIDGGAGNDTVYNYDTNVTISGGAGDDSIYNASLASNISINAGDGNDYIYNSGASSTLIGGEGNDTISNSGEKVLISDSDGDDYIDNSGSNVTIAGGAGNDYIYNRSGEDVTINGGAGDNQIVLNGGTDITVKVSEGNDTISVNSLVTSFNVEGFDAGDVIQLAKTVSAIETIDGGIKAGSWEIIGLVATTEEFRWSLADNVATYAKHNDEILLSDDKKSISYKSGTIGEALVTVGGVKSYEGLTLDTANKIVTVATSALNESTVTISNGYTLALADDVEESQTTPAGWTLYNDTATYKTESTSAGYSLVNNQISYKEASGGETFTVSGVISTDGLSINGNTVTVADSALYGMNVTISDSNYKLALADDVEEPQTTPAIWILDKGTANYIGESSSGGYRLNNNQIEYYGGASVTTFIELDGIATAPTLINNTMQFSPENFAGNVYIKSLFWDNFFEFNYFELLEGNYSNKAFSSTPDKSFIYNDGLDFIYNNSSSISINGGNGNDCIETGNLGSAVSINAGRGDDYIINSGSSGVIFEYAAGDGNDTITGFDYASTLIISDSSYTRSTVDGNVIIGVGNGSITLEDATGIDLNIIGTLVDSDADADADTDTDADSDNELTTLLIDKSEKSPITLGTNVKNADASKRIKKIQINGNDLANSIVGGKGNDTLDGATDDDTLTGGNGNDLFIYSGGNDLITDYTDKDKIHISGYSTYKNLAFNDSDLIFGFDKSNSLTIANGVGKPINMNSSVNTFIAEGVIDKNNKSIKLFEDTEIFNAEKYPKLVTIKGSATGAVEIIGNTKANKIYAGAGGALLNGGKGNDTLRGGDGADVFIYEKNSGKDFIENYGTGDVISLGSDATIKDAYMKSKDVVIKIGTSSITVKNTSEITFMQGNKAINFSNGVFIDDDSAKVYGSFKGTINLSDYKVTNADASLVKKRITIVGDTKNNSLVGGKSKDSLRGGAGDDTLSGGKGNDLLWGGADADTFIYKAGEGNDTIMDYKWA